MEDDPISLSGDLSGDVRVFRDRFRASDNADVIIRRFRSGAFFSALVTIDGMTDTREIDENILKPCMDLPGDAGRRGGGRSARGARRLFDGKRRLRPADGNQIAL